MNLPRLIGVLLLSALASIDAVGQSLPLTINLGKSHDNFQTTNGVPISDTRNVPPGSDGRAPGASSGLLETPNQFQSLVGLSGTITNRSKATNAAGTILLVALRTRAGAPYAGSLASYLFGQIIPPPDTDEYGVSLALPNGNRLPTTAEDYWRGEPHSTDAHTGAGYYWSPHAEKVYAAKPGAISITWRKVEPSTPVGTPLGVTTMVEDGRTYTLLTQQEIVSPAPVKPPRHIYWTEGPFAQLGRAISIPTDRIKDIKVIYNDQFPQFTSLTPVIVTNLVQDGTNFVSVVATNLVRLEYPFDGTQEGAFAITNTLWYNRTLNSLRAYNLLDRRVFVEFLGDKRGQANNQDIHQQLGYEIVEVIQRPIAADVTTELGERLTPFQGASPAGTPELFADPIINLGQEFVYRHSVAGTPEFDYYAVRETQNQNDYQMHWMEEGIQGLRWPYRYVRYKMIWPGDVAKYSHYVRPVAATESEASSTAVALPAQNAPQIAYQDPLDQPRGKLTENFAYYSWLTPEYPAHRALLRFTAGEYVRFERVFSWLDENLKTTNFTGTVAANLTSVADYLTAKANYPAAYAIYLAASNSAYASYLADRSTYLAALPRDVNKIFKLRVQSGASGSLASWALVVETATPGTSSRFTNEFSGNGFTVPAGGDTNSSITVFGITNAVTALRVKLNGFSDANPSQMRAMINIGNSFGDLMAFVGGTTAVNNLNVAFDDRAASLVVGSLISTTYKPWVALSIWLSPAPTEPSPPVGPAPPPFPTPWPSEFVAPRVVNSFAVVGQRIGAPAGELGSGLDTDYLAGSIRASEGDRYHPGAYIDPFVSGFDLANQGTIIPVNAIPGQNLIEVWWFRKNQVDATRGFRNAFWPSVIGRYTTGWPTDASEIILASNDGSGALPSLEAKGGIYIQNDPSQPGYNPNEEHAMMQGGQVYALRDDLNLTATTVPAVLESPAATYSSEPFVLLDYTESDGKRAIRLFRVRREKPEAGITFEYQKRAAQILQPPMPLVFVGPAFAPKIPGQPRLGLNEELVAWEVTASKRTNSFWTLTTDTTHGFRPFWSLALQDTNPPTTPTTRWFFATNVTDNAVEGVVSTNRPFALATASAAVVQPANPFRWRFGTASQPFPVNSRALLALPESGSSWPVTITAMSTNAPAYVEVDFGAARPEEATNASTLQFVVSIATVAEGAFDGWRLAWNELPKTLSDPDRQKLYAAATVTDRKGNVWVYRGPHRADRSESFSMRFYYKTLPGFFFPTLAQDAQPPIGTVTPYLRKMNRSGGFVGDPVYGNQDADQEDDKNALPIIYHPYWPADAPVLQMAETLTTAKRGLPAVRGQSSVQVIYQQSQIKLDAAGEVSIDSSQTSVVLHDPTREKTVELDQALLPASIRTEMSRGKLWFPNLPPHLVKRFWFDPNRGAKGMLVFTGEFVDSPLGDKYVLLNVAGTKDADALRDLCPRDSGDSKRGGWVTAIDALATDMERFVENPAVPGTYIPHPVEPPLTIGLGEVAQVTDDDVAVDSYALTAIGPATGYVTLIAGNSLSRSPEAEPVSMEVIRVVPNLYRGELAVIESENPLSEKLTMQQVVDLAGHAEDYTFDWRITAPVDGQPPPIYSRQPWRAVPSPWSHVRFPLTSEGAATITGTSSDRVAQDISDLVVPVSALGFNSVQKEGDFFRFTLDQSSLPHHLTAGNRLLMSSEDGTQVQVTVHEAPPAGNEVLVSFDPNQAIQLEADRIFRLTERVLEGRPQSIVFSSFVVNSTEDNLTDVWLSLSLAEGLAAKVYLNGGLAVATGFSSPDDNTTPANPPSLLASPRLNSYFRLPPSALAGGMEGPDGRTTNILAVELFAPALPGALLDFQARVEAVKSIDQVEVVPSVWLPLDTAQYEDGVRAIIGGTADVRSLSDNYLTMRYRPNGNPTGWSQWTEPQLAEGWIKRVLKGINPFNQRITDLYNNAVNTDVSVISQAGARWEGNIALNLESMNNYGLIEIYETVLNRGKDLSINADINYGPANDALLLAAGYINDLYMLVGNEAAADAANPTIGIGTANHTYSDIATALFSFKGQLPTLLAEELSLLRGRDDFLVPGVETRPVYNRMVWNYTRGIDAGEVIYALNYNILDKNTDGKVDALDALKLYPQGHGDAYGHYLTALSGYYHLLLNPNFDWVPRSEAVLVLGKPVSVDYQDERKFAGAAGALARTGRQIFDLTWRQDFRSGTGYGWEHFRPSTGSNKRTRYWGIDHWASRTAQGAYVNWIVGNAILPFQDPEAAHADTIQQVDRTTVPELKELPSVLESLQIAMDNAESGLTPLGLPEDSVPFDLNPNGVTTEGNTHFEQIHTRAKTALQNAVVAFDDAKDVTRLMRSEEDSVADLRAAVDKQELAYTNALIELFGTPYPEDIGPGKTYRTGYAGPDLVHPMYVDNVELEFRNQMGGSMLVPSEDYAWSIDTQSFTANWLDAKGISDFSFIQPARNGPVDGTNPSEEWMTNTTLHVDYNLTSHGFFKKPATWVGRRVSPGKLQQAISDIAKARNAAFTAFYWADAAKYDLDWAIQTFERKKESRKFLRNIAAAQLAMDQAEKAAKLGYDIFEMVTGSAKLQLEDVSETTLTAIPQSLIMGLAVGGDLGSGARAAISASLNGASMVLDVQKVVKFSVLRGLEYANQLQKATIDFGAVAPEQFNQELRDAMSQMRDKVYGMNNNFMTINARLQELDDAQRKYRGLLAESDRIQAEREIFRNRTAAVIQGYRTRDAAFRIFRNEKLERYKSLFDLAAQYTFMAAKAYDYETGLLGTDRGREFINRIVNARALGVVKNGQPQFAGSNNGDPGLSSVLAEMAGDWSVVKSRLGFNNPDAYGTTASLRYENFRIITNEVTWKGVMNQARKDNLLDDPDVRRYCLQIDKGDSLPVPGLVFEFGTAIADGLNLFGRPLAGGDHAFSDTAFATKIFAAGVALEGYVGMDDPAANSGAVGGSGGSSPPDPSLIFLDQNALAANPYIYLIPVGVDSMRSPPLGDTSDVRTWSVDDVAIPLPFNIGGSDYSSVRLWQSTDSLTEAPFTIRKHQAFRPVSSADVFSPNIYAGTGGLTRSQFTSNRLIGRSVWNSKWKIVIPGRTLFNEPNEGIERFLRTVRDVKLHFVTYSYSGN